MKDESEKLSPAAENALRSATALLQPDMTTEAVMDLLETTEKGQVRNLITNAETILSYDPLLREAIRYNELTQRVDIAKDLGWDRGSSGPGLDDNDLNNIHLYCERTYGITSQKLIEEAIKSFLSRQKEIYRTPYERYPKDRPRQCVFAGTTNKISFLPSDRTGNRRFLPIACQESEAEVFILDDEKASREYIRQMWAEVMEIWRSGKTRLKLSPEIEAEVRQRQRRFMQEDVDAGLILEFMLNYEGDKVCSKQLFKEALHNEFSTPQKWQYNEINEIMNQLIRDGLLPGWRYFDSPRRFGAEYGTQKGWERIRDPVPEVKPDVNQKVSTNDGFRQVELGDDIPFDF